MLLPELPPVYVDMTVEEYLNFAAELKKVVKAERKANVEKVMEMTQITDMRKRLIRNLSKGYKQRVGLAQAILGEPEVIILDEPTVGLDPKQIIEIRDLIRTLGENHTVILSSHILSEVSAVCDHIMIISKGKLVASDSPEGLKKLMSTTGTLELDVKGDWSKVQSVLSTIEGVSDVENCGEMDLGCVKVKVTSVENVDVREAVFYRLAEANLPILYMQYSEKSLEDIFLELTGEEAMAEAEAEAREKASRRRRKRAKAKEAQAEAMEVATNQKEEN